MYFAESTLGEHLSLDLAIGEFFISLDDNLVYFHFLLLVYLEIQDNVVFIGHIITLTDGDFGIFVPFVVEVFLCQDFGTVEDIGRHLASLDNTEFCIHIVAFRLLQSDVIDGRYAWPHIKVDKQIDFVANNGVGRNRDF